MIEIAIVALVFGILGFCAGVWGLIEVLSYKKSTHKIEWRTLNEKDTQSEEEMNKLLQGQLDDIDYDQV